MALGENNGEPDGPLGEWSDTTQVASALQELVNAGLTIEAMVRLQRLRVADQADVLVQTSPNAQTALPGYFRLMTSARLSRNSMPKKQLPSTNCCRPAGFPMSLMQQAPT